MKPLTLKLNKEFRRAYGRGKSFVSPVLVTYVVPNRLGCVRIGITAGKKVGNAVARNRAKRVIMAAFLNCHEQLVGGADIVFVARQRTPFVSSNECLDIMQRHLTEAGLII